MKNVLVVLIIIVSSINLIFADEAISIEDDYWFNIEVLEKAIDDFIIENMEERNILGLVFTFFTDQKILLSKGYGYQDIANQVLVDPQKTIFRVCSVSKVVTYTALMQLYEEGYFSLDDTISDYLTSIEIDYIHDEDISFRSLFTHTAGFDQRELGVGSKVGSSLFLDIYLEKNMPRQVMESNKIITYNNATVTLAGLLVEEISGQSFGDFVNENITRRIGMKSSGFNLDNSYEDQRAIGYTYNKDKDSYEDFTEHYYSNYYPAVGFEATGEDMALFGMSHLSKESSLLNENSLRKMHQTQFTHHEDLAGMTLGFFEHYERGERLVVHAGDMRPTHSSYFVLSPDNNFGFFVSYNTIDYQLRDDLLSEVLRNLFPNRWIIVSPNVTEKHSDAVNGYYQFSRYSHNTMQKAMSALEQFRVEIVDDGISLYGAFSNKPIKAIAIDDYLYQIENSNQRLSYQVIDNKEYLFIDSAALIKISFHRTYLFHIGLLLLLLGTFALFVIIFLVIAIRRRKKRFIFTKMQSDHKMFYVPAIIAILNLTFVISIVFYIRQNFYQLYYPMTLSLRLILTIPILSIVLTVFSFIKLISYIRSRDIKIPSKILYTGMTFVNTVFLLFLNYWNLIGYKY